MLDAVGNRGRLFEARRQFLLLPPSLLPLLTSTFGVPLYEPALKSLWIGDDVRELLRSCLRNAWVYVDVMTLLLSVAVVELRSYCLPLGLFMLSVGVFKGALSLTGRLREEITESFTTSPCDSAVEELVRRMLSKFDAKERAVLLAPDGL